MEMQIIQKRKVLFGLWLLLQYIYGASSQPFMGVVLNTAIPNVPREHELSQFLNATSITKVRMNYYDPSYIDALQDTTVRSVIVNTAENTGIPIMARDKEDFCRDIVNHLRPNIRTLLVGDKVFESGDQSIIDSVLPAMENIQSVIDEAGLRGKVKISTVVSTNSLTRSDIPSEAAFKPAYLSVIVPWLQFMRETDSALHVSTFPYYDYIKNKNPKTLKLCLFQPNSCRLDPISGKNYTNMFAIKVDSVRNALDGLGFEDIKIVVAETGWPTKDDIHFKDGLTAAKVYNWNLICYLRSMVGTPLMPNKPVDTYIFSLFDSRPLDPDVADELKSCGIIHEDLSWKYELCLRK